MADEIGGSELGELIRSRREMASTPHDRMTADRLADLLGVNQGTVSSWETGRTRWVRPEMANALARVIPVTVDELCRAMGFELTPPRGLPKWLTSRRHSRERAILETADDAERESILAMLLGLYFQRQGKRLPEPSGDSPAGEAPR